MCKVLKNSAEHLNEDKFDDLVEIAKLIKEEDEYINSYTSYPNLPKGTIGFLVPVTYYNINMKITTIVLSATILDSLATSGLINAALALSGIAKRTIYRIDPENGEYCILVNAKKAKEEGEEITAKNIHRSISGNECLFKGVECAFCKKEICFISEENINEIFKILENKLAIEKKEGEWILPL